MKRYIAMVAILFLTVLFVADSYQWQSKLVHEYSVRLSKLDSLTGKSDTLVSYTPILNVRFPADSIHFHVEGPLGVKVFVEFESINLNKRLVGTDTVLTKLGTDLGKTGTLAYTSLRPDVFQGRLRFTTVSTDTVAVSNKIRAWYIYKENK
jgi:hypothetical protein